jgi:hypothetical protein
MIELAVSANPSFAKVRNLRFYLVFIYSIEKMNKKGEVQLIMVTDFVFKGKKCVISRSVYPGLCFCPWHIPVAC